MRAWLGSLIVGPALFACASPDLATAPSASSDLTGNVLAARRGIPGGRRCAFVRVQPNVATLPIGGQVALEAATFNKKGNPIPSGTVVWTTRNVNVAAVSSSGLVTGVGTGGTYVVAMCARTVGDSAFITVAP